MKFAYLFVCFILTESLFAANCHAKQSPCAGGSCSPLTPTIKTLELTIPVAAVVAPAPKVTERRVVKVAVAPVKAVGRVVAAVRERECKPVVRLVQAVRERERRPVARVARFVLRRR